MLEQTKQQIRSIVNEIAQISRSDVAPDAFQAEFMTRVVRALGAKGGVMWNADDSGRLSLGYQVNLRDTKLHEDEEANKQHSHLLYHALRGTETEYLLPPHSGGENAEDGGNPTDFLVILGVIQTELEKVGIVEVFQRADASPATQQGFLNFVKQVTRYATEYYKNRQLKNFNERQNLWTQLEDFTRNIHKTLDLKETLYTVANESRRLIECDRVSLAICRGGRARIEAVSGQDMVDKRSETVKLLGDLATAVVAANEPVVYNGDGSNLAPQVEDAIEEYVDASHTKTIAVYPLVKRTVDEKDHDETERDKIETPPPFGAIVVELIENAHISDHMMKRVEIVVEHARVAVGNAIEHNSIFLAPLWQAIGKSKILVSARMLPKTVSIGIGVLALILAFIFVPWNFNMHCDGTLEPIVRSNIFATEAGKVEEIMPGVAHKAKVKAGDPLLALSNKELEAEVEKNLGELNEVGKQIVTYTETLHLAKEINDRVRVQGQLDQALQRKKSLEDQKRILESRKDDLIIRAPIDGEIMTFDLENKLRNRPVQPGQILMEIAQPDGELILELNMPEKRMGHIVDYQKKILAEKGLAINDAGVGEEIRTESRLIPHLVFEAQNPKENESDDALKSELEPESESAVAEKSAFEFGGDQSFLDVEAPSAALAEAAPDSFATTALTDFDPSKKEGVVPEGARLKASFVLMVDPSKSYDAEIYEMHARAENRGTDETTVQLRAKILAEDHPAGARAGAGVSAKVYCGKRSLGYVCFNELIAFLQRTVFFWFE